MAARLAGKIALVTAAAGGIGRAQAIRFAQEGADVIVVDGCGPIRTGDTSPGTLYGLAETERAIVNEGRRAVCFGVDVRDGAELKQAIDAGVQELGGLDIICATAGITPFGFGSEPVEATWQAILDVHLTGVWQTCKAAVPHLIERGEGSIILTSSVAGLRAMVGAAHYTSAEHGVVGLMRSLAKELAPYKIRVNSLHPTIVDTPIIRHELARRTVNRDRTIRSREEFIEAAKRMNMLDIPWIDAVDVANAALFLASDEARYITSVVLPVDAGSSQR
ncbi:mycofactocin-coupled SDR family oxidoreductase [Rhodococcus sp. G-MC3]|uniref:mycofactocin-coupled SDR family oxidoreductase n=1 Tax=Rhodococcus sp. G-MC3 TaxID=3046209 RepID=UPI0024B8D6EF|nr:mycofactocin-coupled SDR family oxidoreductase [Rhodococcus sp. G-MC3]MDJ0394873.1 mycofactocin-coupled SDR family oxidoreductase [Rhodococcus sp. G-MC3]